MTGLIRQFYDLGRDLMRFAELIHEAQCKAEAAQARADALEEELERLRLTDEDRNDLQQLVFNVEHTWCTPWTVREETKRALAVVTRLTRLLAAQKDGGKR